MSAIMKQNESEIWCEIQKFESWKEMKYFSDLEENGYYKNLLYVLRVDNFYKNIVFGKDLLNEHRELINQMNHDQFTAYKRKLYDESLQK